MKILNQIHRETCKWCVKSVIKFKRIVSIASIWWICWWTDRKYSMYFDFLDSINYSYLISALPVFLVFLMNLKPFVYAVHTMHYNRIVAEQFKFTTWTWINTKIMNKYLGKKLLISFCSSFIYWILCTTNSDDSVHRYDFVTEVFVQCATDNI